MQAYRQADRHSERGGKTPFNHNDSVFLLELEGCRQVTAD